MNSPNNRKHKRPYGRGRSVTFRLRMTPEERKQLDADAARAGYEETSMYIRWLVERARGRQA